MGVALRNPNHIFSLLCESASVLEGAVLVQGAANDRAALPSGANSREAFLGLAHYNGSTSANEPVTIVGSGIWAGRAGGSITRGDALVIGGATGTVTAEALATPADATRVGRALESVSSGERVAVLLGSPAPFRGVVERFTSSSAITANTIVVATGSSRVGAPSGADPTSGVIGVALNATTGSGETVYVLTWGYATVTDSGAGVTFGDFLAVASIAGTGKTAAPGAGTNNHVVGIVLATTAASGSIPVQVAPCRIQG